MGAPDVDTVYPGLDALSRHLIRLFKARGASAADFRVVEREPLAVPRTHPSERVICVVDGRRQDLCCKYGGHSDAEHQQYGYRHGIAYEAAVYENLLRTIDVTVAGFLGAVEEAGSTWLVMEYLDDSTPVSRTGTANALSDAGRWLGQFHRLTAPLVASGASSFLHRCSADYYLGCAERTLRFAAPLARRWLPAVVRRYADWVVPLLLDHQTVIHGEFYSSNVLYRSGVVLPIDWESAAIGAPETDLAFLLEGWSEEEKNNVLEAYAPSRWPDGAPADFGVRFEAARMFSQFRWLGDRPEWTLDRENQWRFDILREFAGTPLQ